MVFTGRNLSLEAPGPIVIDGDLLADQVWRNARGATLLVQPVRQAAAVLEEWSRYDMPNKKESNLMQPFAFHGNFGCRTTNTTCGLLRGTPEFLIMEHEEAAEFVASLPVLIESWTSQVRVRANYNPNDFKKPDDIVERQLDLRKVLAKATAVMAEIRSSDLCRTAVHRKLLNEMYEMAGIERFEEELRSHFEVLDAQFNTLATRAARTEQKRLDKQAFFFGAGAVLVGVPSLAALFSLVDDGNKVHKGYWDGWENVEAAALFVLFLVFLVLVLKLPGARGYLRSVGDFFRASFRPLRWLRAKFAEVSGKGLNPIVVADLAHRPDATSLLDRLYREILTPCFRSDELVPYVALASSLARIIHSRTSLQRGGTPERSSARWLVTGILSAACTCSRTSLCCPDNGRQALALT